MKRDESTKPKAECFYCFEVFGTPDEKLALVFDLLLTRLEPYVEEFWLTLVFQVSLVTLVLQIARVSRV